MVELSITMCNMALHKVFNRCFLLGLMLHYSDGSLRLDVDPAGISPGLTKSLNVNCSFSYVGVSSIYSIISLIISKTDAGDNQPSNLTELVSVNVFSPDQIHGLSQVNAEVSGQIDASGESYLRLEWAYPKADQGGVYLCEVHGVDQAGHPTHMSQNATVTSEQPDLNRFVDKISDLQRQVDGLETLANNQSTLNTFQETEIDILREVTQNQSKVIGALLSLTVKQSESLQSMRNFQDYLMKVPDIHIFHVSPEYHGHRYLLSKEGWNNSSEALKVCESYDGYLAEISDSEENQFVKDFVDSYPAIGYVLLSGTDEGHEDHWVFTNTNQTMQFTDWYSSEPDNGSTWNCLNIQRVVQWQWRDYQCNHSISGRNFLCEVTYN